MYVITDKDGKEYIRSLFDMKKYNFPKSQTPIPQVPPILPRVSSGYDDDILETPDDVVDDLPCGVMDQHLFSQLFEDDEESGFVLVDGIDSDDTSSVPSSASDGVESSSSDPSSPSSSSGDDGDKAGHEDGHDGNAIGENVGDLIGDGDGPGNGVRMEPEGDEGDEQESNSQTIVDPLDNASTSVGQMCTSTPLHTQRRRDFNWSSDEISEPSIDID